MAKASQAALVAFMAITIGAYYALSNAYGGDREAMMQSFSSFTKDLGVWAIPVYILVHTIAIATCFPYAIAFEAGASFLFGFRMGVVCVFCAKVSGAAVAFGIGRALFRSSTMASNLVQKNKYFTILSEGVAQDGWKFVLLARFSPVPSYIINYGLAATDVHFVVDFLLPTLVGGIPMILQNTCIGTLTSTVADGSTKSNPFSYILPGIGLLSGVLITWRIKKYASRGFGSKLQESTKDSQEDTSTEKRSR